jgi:hypothetical protein
MPSKMPDSNVNRSPTPSLALFEVAQRQETPRLTTIEMLNGVAHHPASPRRGEGQEER